MKCTRCNTEVSGLNGNLVRLSPEILSKLYNSPLYEEVKNSTSKKHITLCINCLKEALGAKNISLDWFDFKGDYWYIINLQCVAQVFGISPVLVIKSPLCSKFVSRVKKSETKLFLNSLTNGFKL